MIATTSMLSVDRAASIAQVDGPEPSPTTLEAGPLADQ